MQSRVDCLLSYQSNLKRDLQLFSQMVASSSGKIFLVTSNTECTRNIVLNTLSSLHCASNCRVVSSHEISASDNLSPLVYSCIMQEKSNMLVLDFSDVYVGDLELDESKLRLLEEINSNRDIFIDYFQNTVLIFSSSMSYWFQTLARDIYSCVSFHLNMEDWFIIPEDLPIFHINFPYTESGIAFDQDHYDLIVSYNSLKREIESLTRYTANMEKPLLVKIDALEEPYRSSLSCLLLKKISSIPTSVNLTGLRKKSVLTWNLRSMDYVVLAQSHCYVGEFLYLNGDYSDAISHFKEAISIIDSKLRDNSDIGAHLQIYKAFLACNKMMCVLKSGRNDNGFQLLQTLHYFLDDACNENDSFIRMYAQSYLFIYNVCLGNCNYVTLLDLYEREDSGNRVDEYTSVNIYKNMLMWVRYIVCDSFKIPENLDISNAWSQLHITMISMIQNFRIGSYKDATHFYKKAKDRINELGHMQMRGILKAIRNNMLFLRKLESESKLDQQH